MWKMESDKIDKASEKIEKASEVMEISGERRKRELIWVFEDHMPRVGEREADMRERV